MELKASHTPVLRDEVCELLRPGECRVLVDCTIGLGGHSEALLESAPQDAILIALDIDESNLASAKTRLSRYGVRARFFHANFADLPEVLSEVGVSTADLILADLGVASSQLGDSERGFAFTAEGPLDMRMDLRSERTAADLLGTLSEKDLADLIYSYGEERYSRRIARAIIEERARGAIETTTQLARIVERAYPRITRRTRRGTHPATRTFQALRIAVNDELGNLDRLLELLPQVLAVGARAGLISFHSLEDRRIKHTFARLVTTGVAKLLNKKPITASDEEVKSNPRSRSAKLRGIERIA